MYFGSLQHKAERLFWQIGSTILQIMILLLYNAGLLVLS